MLKNASFASIALFWVIMNALLWHSEIGSGTDLTAKVPVESVWERILTAPDASALSINFDNKKIGFVRWRPNIGLAPESGPVASENELEGIVRKLTEYSVDIEGSLVAETLRRSLRFTGDLHVDPYLKWKRFQVTVMFRPAIWRMKGNAANRELWLEAEEDGTEIIRRLTFEELSDPRTFLNLAESPLIEAMLAQNPAFASQKLSLNLDWTARYEWLRIGQSRVRVYRLKADILDRHEINILISRVGEILRIELPFKVRLINDTLFER